jgi:hypothetical protein
MTEDEIIAALVRIGTARMSLESIKTLDAASDAAVADLLRQLHSLEGIMRHMLDAVPAPDLV